jgi:hypothetical protein
VAPRPFEGLLGDVLGQRDLAHDAQRHAEHAPLKPAHELEARVGIADDEPR